MENSTLEKPKTVTSIIKTGVNSYLNQNKNIGVKDLLTKKGRQTAGNQLKTTLKSTALDTGQNVINHLRKEDIAQFDKLVKAIKGTPNLNSGKTAKLLKIAGKIRGIGEEVSRRNKPSNIKKKKTLDAALEKLNKKRSSCKEDFTGVLRKDDPVRRTPGKTISTTAKTTGYVKGDLPADKKKKQLPKSKSTAIVKTGDKKDKKQKLTPNTPGKDRVAQGGPIEKSKEKEKEKGGIKDYTNKKKGVIARRKAKERLKNAAKNVAQGVADNATKVTGGVSSAYGTSSFKEDRTSNWRSELSEVAPALAVPFAVKALATAKAVAPYVATAVGAGGMIHQMSKRKSPGQGNFFPKGSAENPLSNTARAKASRNKTISNKGYQNRKAGNDAEARANAQRGSYDKSIKPSDNPEARSKIRDLLDKLNKKNNKLYKDYNNPKP